MGDMEMNAQASELQAENNLKQLMAEVTRAMEKAQEAVAKIVSKTETATAAMESTNFVAIAKIRNAGSFQELRRNEVEGERDT